MSKNRCSHEGCTHGAKKGGVCSHTHHVLVFKHCSQEGCTNQAILGGVCVTHGAMKRCSHAWCIKQARKRGLCRQHYRIRYEATTTELLLNQLGLLLGHPLFLWVLLRVWQCLSLLTMIFDNAILHHSHRSRTLKIKMRMMSSTRRRRKDDDEEDERVGAWIYKTSRTAKLLAEKVSSSSPSQSESHP